MFESPAARVMHQPVHDLFLSISPVTPFRVFSPFKRACARQVLEQAQKLVDRLQRLDEVLPKYQRLASQLMDILCVQSLEQILPCVQKSFKHQRTESRYDPASASPSKPLSIAALHRI